jgi:esterase/lipase superfamily enzyme
LARRAIGLAAALVLAGCGTRPEPGLTLVDPVPDTRRVEMLAVTTRKPSDNPALRFGGERAPAPSLARLTISIPPGHKVGNVAWAPSGRPDPKAHFAAISYRPLDREALRTAIREKVRLTGHRHLLLFVHGYNTRFDEGVFRLAQIANDSGAPVSPVLFSWASWGTLAGYPYDRESAAVARDTLEMLMAEAAAEPSVSQVSVLAHSMGGWLTLESVRQMVIRTGTVHAKLTDLILASPDVDIDAAQAIGTVLRTAHRKPRITLFVSEDDRALNASRLLWGSRDRLGALDPSKEPYRSGLARAGVEVIDLTAVSSSDPLNHGKFASSPPVVQAIGQRLAAGQALGGPASAGETAHATTHGAVRLVGDVLTSPLTLVVPQGP